MPVFYPADQMAFLQSVFHTTGGSFMEAILRDIFQKFPVLQGISFSWFVFSAIIAASFLLLLVFIGSVFLTAGIDRASRNIIMYRKGFWSAGFVSAIRMLYRHLIVLFHKKYSVPPQADKWIFILSPLLLFAILFALYALVPLNRDILIVNPATGLLLFFSVIMTGSLTIYLGGMASGNIESAIGASRYVLLIMSYFTLSGLAIIPPVLLAGSLNLPEIVAAQQGGILNWMVMRSFPFTLASCMVFLTASMIPVAFNPFSGSFARYEVTGGSLREYGGVLLSFLVIARYAILFVSAGVAAIVFLGGWESPMAAAGGYASVWLLLKILFLATVLCAVNRVLPPLRLDQVTDIIWKLLFIVSIAAITGAVGYEYLLQ